MYFLFGIDGTILGLILEWHGITESNLKLFLFGLAILAISNWLLAFERKRLNER